MTIAVDLGRKATKQTKQTYSDAKRPPAVVVVVVVVVVVINSPNIGTPRIEMNKVKC